MNLGEVQRAVATALIGGELPPGFDHQALRLASVLLIGKRRVEAAAWLPRTHEMLGPAWNTRFALHASSYRPSGWNHPRDDALAFAKQIADDPHLPRIIRDTARFETLQIRATIAQSFLAAFAVHGEENSPLNAFAGVHVWWRWRPGGRLHHLHLRWLSVLLRSKPSHRVVDSELL